MNYRKYPQRYNNNNRDRRSNRDDGLLSRNSADVDARMPVLVNMTDKEMKDYKIKCLLDIISSDGDHRSAGATKISAIAELNKMQGHYAPSQTQNINLNIDIAEALELMEKVKEKERDF